MNKKSVEDRCSNQVNVKLTGEDIEEMKKINESMFCGEATMGMVARSLIRRAIKNYKEKSETKNNI